MTAYIANFSSSYRGIISTQESRDDVEAEFVTKATLPLSSDTSKTVGVPDGSYFISYFNNVFFGMDVTPYAPTAGTMYAVSDNWEIFSFSTVGTGLDPFPDIDTYIAGSYPSITAAQDAAQDWYDIVIDWLASVEELQITRMEYADQTGTLGYFEFTDGAWADDFLISWNGITRLGMDITGSAYNDVLEGNRGDDRISGGSGKDKILGAAGDDTLSGEAGNDRFSGGGGADRIDGGSGRDRIAGEKGDDNLRGGSGRDTIYAGQGDDLVRGENGNDLIFGSFGNDTLLGNVGSDILWGGAGNDNLRGGGDADTFAFEDTPFGDDVIRDFEDGVDSILLLGAAGFDELTITVVDGDTLIEWQTSSILLEGITSGITTDDFSYGVI